MTFNSHSDVGAAQIAFYVSAFLVACVLVFYVHGRPRMAWTCLMLFSAVRIAGGATLIIVANHRDSVGYIIAGLVLEGTGVIPLILSTIGLLRIMRVPTFRRC